MAGISIPGSKYLYNGFYGTAQEHAARQQAEQDKLRANQAEIARQEAAKNTVAQGRSQYDVDRASAQSATEAARLVGNRTPGLDFSVDPTGRTNVTNASALARQAEEARYARDKADRERSRKELLDLINSHKRQPAATVTHPGAGGNEDARNAAFSRAKDRAGQIARASLTSIAEEMAGRGIGGSGIEALREAGVIGGAGSSLIDVTRDQAIADAERAGDVNDLIYQGGIQQRGQDLSNRESYLALLRSIYSY